MAMDNPPFDGNVRPFTFPALPIITVDPPRMTQREKYGGLFYLGLAGLVIVLGLVGWFGWSAWSLRGVWWNVYALHDASRPESVRIQAAYTLSHDVRVNSQQRWDIAMRKPLPPLARYLLAESLRTDIVATDPALFAKVVALSEGWPDWLRVLGVRAMAMAAAEGTTFPDDVLTTLADGSDPFVRSWVDTIRAVSGVGDRDASARLRAVKDSPTAAIDRDLAGAIDSNSFERSTHLGRATARLRTDHPEAAKLWEGWAEREGRLVRDRP